MHGDTALQKCVLQKHDDRLQTAHELYDLILSCICPIQSKGWKLSGMRNNLYDINIDLSLCIDGKQILYQY